MNRAGLRRAVIVPVVSLLLLAPAAPAAAAIPDQDLFVPSVGRGEGNQGSRWYTSLWLYNPGTAATDVTVALLLRDQPNRTPEEQHLTVAAGSTLMLPDALWELFGLDSAVGALRIRSGAQVVAGARVYNQPGASVAESQGQLMVALPSRLAIRVGERTDVPGVLQPADGSFRSNFGLVETAGATADVLVTLYDGDGIERASRSYTLGPYAALQRAVTALGSATVMGGRLGFEVVGGSGAVLAYASAVASGTTSQDPTTLEMDFPALAEAGGGDVTGVVAGPGLSGGGDEGEVTLSVRAADGIVVTGDGVAIRPGGVRADHVAPGQLVLGMKVGTSVLHDVVTLAGGDGVTVSSSGNMVTISAEGGGAGARVEKPLTATLEASTVGSWVVGADRLRLPSAGRWRVGYRVLTQVQNLGVGTSSDPVTLALVDVGHGSTLIRGSLSVVGLQVGIGITNTAFLTVDGEAVLEIASPGDVALAARTSSSSLRATVHPHDVDLSAGLAAPDATSFLYAEALAD